MFCENCNKEHDGSYGSGRFCSKQCARAFSTKSKRNEINKKVSKSLTGRKLSETHIAKIKQLWTTEDFRNRPRRQATPIENILIENGTFTSKYVKDRLVKEGIKQYVCEECGIASYRGLPLTLQLHHVNGIQNDHRVDNLQLLCPNCHSQTDNYAGKNRTLRSSTE